MGEPFGKASRRTFRRMGTCIPFPNWNSPKVASFDDPKTSDEPPSEALKGGLPMAGSATGALTHKGLDLEERKFFSTTIRRIKALKENGRYEEAEEEIQRGLEENPDHSLLKVSLADLSLRQGRLKESRVLVEEVLAQDPQDPQALSVLGDIFLRQRSPK
ncbi:MAG: tetratricopeptide repeat protein, partial [Deltaproteobacteria bacterium]